MSIQHFLVGLLQGDNLAAHIGLIKQKTLNLVRHRDPIGEVKEGVAPEKIGKRQVYLVALLALETLDISPLFFIRTFQRVLHDFIGETSGFSFLGTSLDTLFGFRV